MRLRRWALVALTLLAASLLTGCWDRKELEETAFVLAIGLDRGDQAPFAVTAAIAIPSKMAGGKGGGSGTADKPLMLITVQTNSIPGALALIDSSIDRRVSLLHTKALFMEEALAREDGMTSMDAFVRFRQARRTTFYIVTKGKAATFLKKMNPVMETDPQRFIEQLTYNSRSTGMIPAASQIQSFVTSANTGYTQPITYYAALKEPDKESTAPASAEDGYTAGEIPRKGGPNLELFGGAAFRHSKMVGVLTGEEMRYILLLQGRFQRGFFAVSDPQAPDKYIALDMRQGRPLQVSVDLSGNRPRVYARVTLEGEILATQSENDYTEPELQPKLEAAAVAQLQRGIRDLIKKTQDWNADVIGLGHYVVRKFATVSAWEAANWPDRYKDADIQVDVRMTIRRFGVQLSRPKASQ